MGEPTLRWLKILIRSARAFAEWISASERSKITSKSYRADQNEQWVSPTSAVGFDSLGDHDSGNGLRPDIRRSDSRYGFRSLWCLDPRGRYHDRRNEHEPKLEAGEQQRGPLQ